MDFFPLVMKTVRIYSLSSFQVYNIAVLAISSVQLLSHDRLFVTP